MLSSKPHQFIFTHMMTTSYGNSKSKYISWDKIRLNKCKSSLPLPLKSSDRFWHVYQALVYTLPSWVAQRSFINASKASQFLLYALNNEQGSRVERRWPFNIYSPNAPRCRPWLFIPRSLKQTLILTQDLAKTSSIHPYDTTCTFPTTFNLSTCAHHHPFRKYSTGQVNWLAVQI